MLENISLLLVVRENANLLTKKSGSQQQITLLSKVGATKLHTELGLLENSGYLQWRLKCFSLTDQTSHQIDVDEGNALTGLKERALKRSNHLRPT